MFHYQSIELAAEVNRQSTKLSFDIALLKYNM